MIQNFRGKNIKDVENAYNTVLDNTIINGGTGNKHIPRSWVGNAIQNLNEENFDNYVEKRNKELI